jgi:hypothetical protein
LGAFTRQSNVTQAAAPKPQTIALDHPIAKAHNMG